MGTQVIRTTRLVVGIALLGLVVGACGPKRTELAREAARASTAIESASASGGDATDDLSGPGVTDTTVKIGFIIVDQTQLKKLLRFDSPDVGDVKGQIEALVADANSRGGIGGRTIEPVIVVFDALLDSPDTEEKLCRTFTEDDPVFAVVLYGQVQSNARPCYANRQTLMIDQTFFPVDQKTLEEFSPYLWQPIMPEYGKLLRGLAIALSDNQFFADGAKLGIVGIDSPENRRVVEEDLAPTLASLGVEPTDIQWIDPTSGATLQAGQDQAVLEFKDQEIDRVIVVGGSRLLAFLVTTAIPQEYFPRYAITSFDNPDFIKREMPMALDGSIGISIQPAFDIADSEYPRPGNASEQRCIDVLAAAGHTFAERANMREALVYCDAVALLEQAGRGLNGRALTAAALAEQFTALGSSWLSASNYASAFTPGSFDGVAGFRATIWDSNCLCFTLTKETVNFPS